MFFEGFSPDFVAQDHANPAEQTRESARRSPLPGEAARPAALRLLLASALLLAGAHPALALEPSTPLANYGRQAWVMENGLPQNTVQALLQTGNGFIWLGTEVGLVRFDGNSFQLFDRNSTPALPDNDIRCLLETRDGALWIGTSDGLARWKDGAVTAFTTQNGLPGNGIRALVMGQDGSLWVYTDDGLARQKGERFRAAGDWQPGTVVTAWTADGGSSYWIDDWQHSGDAWRQLAVGQGLPKDDLEFLAQMNAPSTAVGSKSSLMLESSSGLTMLLTVGKDLPGSRIQCLFVDREGALWIGTNGGLARWAGGELQRFPVTDPLATASVLALMEDHEGNLWVGTETDGLHILRDQRFRTIGAREGLSSDATTAVVQDSAGTLWAGTAGGGLNALRWNGAGAPAIRSYSVRDGLSSDVILSLAAAPNGDLWVGTPDGLNRIRGGRIDAFTSADGLPDDFIRSLLADADGSLWIGTRRGLTHWTELKAAAPSSTSMETFTQSSGLGSDLVGAMARDSNGGLWVATLAGLSRLSGGRIANYTTANGLSSNVVTALLPQSDGTLLIGTQEHGWDLWDGRRFSAGMRDGLNPANLDRTTIHAILDDHDGHLWFATANGIARCDWTFSEVEAGQAMAVAGCSHWLEFGAADGLRSREMAANSHPSAWRSSDGLLWFATPKGLVEVDPAHFPVNTVPPPVEIERFAVDDVPQPLLGPASFVRIPAGHVHFQFDYAGLSFTAPQKVRYRFMLEGFDRGWTEAGARRSAYYTNIPPGRYTFRVEAANNDGLWNTVSAAQPFELLPHFYQTAWFDALLLASIVGLVVLFLRLRLRHAEGKFRAVLGERNRIAREIHDTLAQGYVGVSVQLEVLAELLRHKKTEAAEKHLDLTRGFVREGLADARQSIWALRSQDSGETTLPVRLRRMAEAEGGRDLQARFSIFGAYRSMPPGTEREFLRVAQEAIHNVKKHSGARQLFVQLEYGRNEISLEVRDDGRGFTEAQEPEHPPESDGHYGLTGMRERAAAIGGTLEVSSEPGAGTTVRLRAPVPKEAKEPMKEQP